MADRGTLFAERTGVGRGLRLCRPDWRAAAPDGADRGHSPETDGVAGPPAQRLTAGGSTHTGRVRRLNEDRFVADPVQGVFLVADGMGGTQAGAAAAEAVAQGLPRQLLARLARLRRPRPRAIRYWLRHETARFSQQLYAVSTGDPRLRGMGTTLVLILVTQGRAHIAHVGDSRAYLLRGEQFSLLTDDHSVVGLLFRLGVITAEEARRHPERGRITRYVGMAGSACPAVRTLRICGGDRLLLCSDGLTAMIPDPQIAASLRAHADPQKACHALIEAANLAGGSDNVTAVVIDPGRTVACPGGAEHPSTVLRSSQGGLSEQAVLLGTFGLV